MSRAIKFRVWSKHFKKMYGVNSMRFYRDGLLKTILPYTPEDELATDANDFELMQFTGLHDKNGREIYENPDLLKVSEP